MTSIAFIDTEIEPKNRRILDIGGVKDNGSSFHSNSVAGFVAFLKGTKFICGHNILNHDLKYIQKAISDAGKEAYEVTVNKFRKLLKEYKAL